MTTDESTVDFEVTFSDGTVQRVAARRVPNSLSLWEADGCRGLSPEKAASEWAINKGASGYYAAVSFAIRRLGLPGAKPLATLEDRLTALGLLVAGWTHTAGYPRADETGERSVVMQRATAEREARLGIAGYGRNPASEVADAAAEVLGGVRVRTVHVGVASGGAWSIEGAEDAIYAATWGRPVTGYVVGLGREMVVVLKQVPRCP